MTDKTFTEDEIIEILDGYTEASESQKSLFLERLGIERKPRTKTLNVSFEIEVPIDCWSDDSSSIHDVFRRIIRHGLWHERHDMDMGWDSHNLPTAINGKDCSPLERW